MKQRTFSQSGPAHRRPRLLIEDPSPALELAEFRRLTDSGFDVGLCSGPCDAGPCPLTKGEDCQLLDLADIVLMGPGMASHRFEVAAEIMRRRPDIPIVVEVPRTDPAQCPPGCFPMYFPVSVEGQIRSLWHVLDWPPDACFRMSPAAGQDAEPSRVDGQ